MASRHEHDLPSGYAAHDHIDNYLITLGSWYNPKKILAIKVANNENPLVTISQPNADDTIPYSQTTYDFSGTASDSDGTVSQIEYQIGQGNWTVANGTDSWSFTASGLSVGANTVSVRAQDDDGAYSDIATRTITRRVQLIADFSATPVSGTAPLEVTFTDESTGGAESWSWDFNNDGTADSTEQNPVYTYAEGGVYSVSLTVVRGSENDTKLREHYIRADGAPAVPTGLGAQAGADNIKLTWEPNTESDLAGYNVYRDTSFGGEFSEKLNTELISNTSYVDGDLNLDQVYYYKVSAQDAAGQESEKSGAVWATVGHFSVVMPDYRGYAGQQVTLQVNTENGRGIVGNGIDIQITYDKNLLTPVEVQKSVLTQDFTFFDNISVADGQLNISGISSTGAIMQGEGHIVDIIFDVAADAQAGATDTNTFVIVKMYDSDINLLPLDYSDTATFTVNPNYILGDVNGDGVVDSGDGLMAQQHILGEITLTYDPPQFQAADMNGDGVIDGADVSMIMRLAVGLPMNPTGGARSLFASTCRGSSLYELSLPQISCEANDLITIPVELNNLLGVAGIDMTLNYDPTMMEFIDAKTSELTTGFQLQRVDNNGQVKITLSNAQPLETGSGTVLNLQFRSEAAVGAQTSIVFAAYKLSGEYGEDAAWTNDVNASNGVISFRDSTSCSNWNLFQ